MYIFLLWAKYLRTRRLAIICMVSVMLGVATLIVVNGVMTGFSSKLTQKLHDMQSDIVIESTDPMVGFPATAADMMARIRQSPAGPLIRAMAPSVDLFALMQFNYRGRQVTHRVRLVGVDPELQKDLPGFAEYLLQPERRVKPSFELDEAARRRWEIAHPPLPADPLFGIHRSAAGPIVADGPALPPLSPREDFQPKRLEELPPIDPPPPVTPKLHGVIVGYGLATYRQGTEDVFVMQPGDSVVLLTLSAEGMQPVWDEFVVCDFIKTEMSEFDAMTVYVSLDYLQHLRTMEGRVNTLQIRLHDESQLDHVAQILRHLFPAMDYHVATWKEKQGTLLAAISVERGILNLLLFMIIGVAGFGILAIFSMIVTEKTRDIGILKSLGASSRGVMSIFLGYGFLLGLLGALWGTGLGLLIVENINEIEMFISRQTGAELFDRRIYYFNEIPTDVRWEHVLAVNVGAIAIAVIFSILPALKASWLHPVRALRYE
jgi:lipoprotein-releasing system permease protein